MHYHHSFRLYAYASLCLCLSFFLSLSIFSSISVFLPIHPSVFLFFHPSPSLLSLSLAPSYPLASPRRNHLTKGRHPDARGGRCQPYSTSFPGDDLVLFDVGGAKALRDEQEARQQGGKGTAEGGSTQKMMNRRQRERPSLPEDSEEEVQGVPDERRSSRRESRGSVQSRVTGRMLHDSVQDLRQQLRLLQQDVHERSAAEEHQVREDDAPLQCDVVEQCHPMSRITKR